MSSGPGQIVRIRRAEEAEAVLQHLDDALPDDLDIVAGRVASGWRTSVPACAAVLAFSTSSSSAKASSSVGDLDLRSWSFISRMWSCRSRLDSTGDKGIDRGDDAELVSPAWPEEAAGTGASGQHPGLRADPRPISLRQDGAPDNQLDGRRSKRRGEISRCRSERLANHDENDDRDHQRGRDLVDEAVAALRDRVAILGESPAAGADKPHVERAHHRRQGANFAMNQGSRSTWAIMTSASPLSQVTIIAGFMMMPEQLRLHHLERLGLRRAAATAGVIDVEPRQIEDPAIQLITAMTCKALIHSYMRESSRFHF